MYFFFYEGSRNNKLVTNRYNKTAATKKRCGCVYFTLKLREDSMH